jgi:hypothetical protein
MYFFSVQFLVLGQHLPAGVNEWLTIRNLDREFFKSLLICRDGDHPGSGGRRGRNLVRRRYGAQAAISGQCDFCGRCGFSAAGCVNGTKMLAVRATQKDLTFWPATVHLKHSAPYTENTNFSCNLNDMRS